MASFAHLLTLNMKYLFACDLDNTLIHSYKHRTNDDICIEIYNGREQSFISSRAVELLKEIVKEVLFIPVTTRSIEQYQRIQWIEGTKPEYTVVSNGANLIHNDNIDKNWRHDIYHHTQPYEGELQEQQKELSRDKNFSICRTVDDSFLFLKCSDAADVESISTELQEQTNLTVQYSGRKIYLFPPKLNKGVALLQLKGLFNPDKVFCAGDSIIDMPMLNLADVAFIQSNCLFSLNHSHYITFTSIELTLEEIIKNFL